MADKEMTDGERLVRIETIIESWDKKLDTFIADHEARLRSLERAKWLFAGGAAAIGAFGREILSALGS